MMRLKAGALQLVTFIVVVIALLLASFIMLIHVHKNFRLKTDHTIETVTMVNHGIDELLKLKSSNNDTTVIKLYDEDYKSLKVHRSYWGSFEKLHSKAKIKTITLNKIALSGTEMKNSNTPALYLTDNNKPLVLVGDTKIKGRAFLPERGIKSGNISGKSYNGEKFVYGATKLSKAFPKLKRELVTNLESLKDFNNQLDGFEIIEIKGLKTLKNSFKYRPKLVYSPSDILLSNISITGQFFIYSDTKIIVDASAQLTDVILYAPEIEIRSNTIGSFQAIASERIHVNNNVSLNYPSALVLQHNYLKDEDSNSRMIRVEDNSNISGHIMALGKTSPTNYDAQIKIDANAIINGSIYCEQNLELRGTVYGSVYTNNFIIKEAGSIYQNHLYNALIDASQLRTQFVALHLENTENGVAKWLY